MPSSSRGSAPPTRLSTTPGGTGTAGSTATPTASATPTGAATPIGTADPAGAAFTIDTPRLEDAAGCARIHVESWRDAYGDLLEDHERWFGKAALERRTAQWAAMLTPGDPQYGRSTIAVGRAPDGQVIGFATAGRTRDEDAPRPLELFALYTDRAWYGTGLGRALVEAVIEDVPASVWVAVANPRARRFYEKLGFRADGAEKVEEHLANLRDIRMVR